MLHLELDPRSGGTRAVVHCIGRIVFHDEAKSLGETVKSLIENHEQVFLDLSQVRDIDSAGLGTLAGLHLFANGRNRSVTFLNPQSFVRDLLELTHLDRELRVAHDGLSAAEAAA